MTSQEQAFPNNVKALKAALFAERERRLMAEAEAAAAKARLSDDEALIAHLKLQIEKLRRELFGPRSERTARPSHASFVASFAASS